MSRVLPIRTYGDPVLRKPARPVAAITPEIEAFIGDLFHTMRAAELDHRSDLANGIVTEELRKGYLWQGELLRLAEVKVNRQPEPPVAIVPPSTESSPT